MAQEARNLREATHNAVYTNKLNVPHPMQYRWSLRDHSSWSRQGPRGTRGRLPVTMMAVGLSWTSRRPIPVQSRVICCILSEGTMKWHRVGSCGPSFVFSTPSGSCRGHRGALSPWPRHHAPGTWHGYESRTHETKAAGLVIPWSA